MKAETKLKIRDWFIITRIRILNFIKEHKYVSAGIGILLMTTIVALVIRAASNEIIDNASVAMEGEHSPTFKVTTEGSSNSDAPNFSTVTYTLNYYLEQGNACSTEGTVYQSDEVEIKAILPNSVNINNVRWGKSDETTSSVISPDGRTITISAPLINMCTTQSQNITLSILNSEAGMRIKPIITIKGGKNSSPQTINESIITEVSTSYDREYSLEPMVSPGIAEKVSNTQRDAIFGVLLGINSSDNITSLKGKYLRTSANVILLASQGSSTAPEYLKIYTDKGFGVYQNSLNYFTQGKVPDLTSTSGRIASFSKTDYLEDINLQTNTAPIIRMTGSKSETYEKYPVATKYKDTTKITYQDGTNVGSYTNKIYKKGEEQPVTEIPLNAEGTYYIHYIVNGNNSSTTMIKEINITKPSNENYSLVGAKNIEIKQNSTYSEPGLYKSTGAVATKKVTADDENGDYTVKYFKEGSDDGKDTLDTSKSGTYIAKYSINETTTPIERTIKIVEQESFVESDSVSVQDSAISKGETFANQDLSVNGNPIPCNSSNKCKYTPETIDSSSTGDQQITFTIIDSKGNEIKVTKKVYIRPQYYQMSIENIIPLSDSITKINDSFYAVGSYYVTVESIRNSSNTNPFDVKLKAIVDGKSSESKIENKQYSNGYDTSAFSNILYVKENSEYVPVDSSSKNGLTGNYYTASMGEEVKMISKFEYGYDADDNISQLNITIPVNGNLTPIAYSTEVSSSSPYFSLKAIYHGEEIKGMADATIKYCTSDTSCFSPEEFDENSQVIEHINIIIKETKTDNNTFEIKPGTIIELGTKYKVKTISATDSHASDLSSLKFNGSVTFAWNSNGESLSMEVPAKYDVYITPYKARTSVGIGKNDNYSQGDSIVLDASKNDTYTIFASTDVISPAMNIKSNIFGYNRVSSIPIIVELPVGVNYVYNKEYEKEPSVSYNGGKTYLTYTYSNVEPNSWIDPIYIDFNIDVSIADTSPQIKVYTGDPNNNDMSINNDVSSIDVFKTSVKTITVQNVENVSYGQYIYSNDRYISNIDKDASFDFSTKLHNNAQTVTNVNVYTVLPYNDSEKESAFSGSFEIENLPSTAKCTSVDASLITKADQVSNENIWQPCDDFKNANGRYSNFSAYKVTYDNITSGDDVDTRVRIYTIGNKPDDSYTFKSYLSYTNSDGTSSGYKNFRDIKLDVVSKKITGVVWEDFNVDGIMDSTEKKIENATLMLYDESNQLIQTTTPNKDGRYTFSTIPEGKYYVVADFNTDKYGVTGAPSEDFYDKARLSAFKEVPITDKEKENYTDEVLNNGDLQNNDLVSSDKKPLTDEVEDEEPENISVIKTDIITIENETRVVRNINLGLSLRKKFEVKLNKYITKAEVTNALGVVTTRDYGKTKLAKLDVKDINNLKIKVVYTIEIQNVKYYPGYVGLVTEEIPDGMSFNPEYAENKGWVLSDDDGSLKNTTLANEVIKENEKKYLTVAFDITRKEAGSFVNFAAVDELNILGGTNDEEKE